MKPTNLSPTKRMKPRPAPLFLLTAFVFSLTLFSQIGQAQQQASLSLADLIIALRSKKLTLPEKNKLLSEAVKTRGITFALTGEIEKELESTGADTELMKAIRQKSVAVAPTPKPTPAPTPAPMPAPTPVPTPKSTAPDYTFYQNRANDYFVKGNYDLAVVDYNKVIELNAKEPSAYLNRGLAYYNTKFYELAVADYNKAIELDPKESTGYFKRGDSYEKMGNIEKAIADYQKAVELDADNLTAKTYLQRLLAERAKNAPPPVAQTPKQVETVKQSETPKQVEAPKETAAAGAAAESKVVNLGSLNDLAVRIAVPSYPPSERQRNIFGLVTVQVSLDEDGDVTAARALDGPRSLRSYAEVAASRSKFKPAVVNGKTVKATGFITYNFKLK